MNEYHQVQYSSSGTMIVLHKVKWGKYSPRSRTGLCSVAKNCRTNRFVWKGAVGDAKIHLCDLRFWWHWLWIILSSEIWHCFVWQTGIHVCFRGRFRLYPWGWRKSKDEGRKFFWHALVPVYQSKYHIPGDSNI
jgi:hypothetical protein